MENSSVAQLFVIAFGANLLFSIWAWLLNHGKGLFFFATDELGLIMLVPLVFLGNALVWLYALLNNKLRLIKAFSFLLLLLLVGYAGIWVHGYKTGVSF